MFILFERILNLGYCNLIDGGLPEDIGCLYSLKELYLTGNNLEHLPRSIAQLAAIRYLDLSHCKRLKEFPQVNDGLRSLEILNLSYCNLIDGGLPEDIGSLSSLKKLYLTGNNFEHFPRSIAQLGALQSMCLSECKRLKESSGFMGMPNLVTLNLSNCTNLEEVHHSLGFLKKLLRLELTNCKRLKRFPAPCADFPYLDLKGCCSLEIFPEILGSMNLELENGIWRLDLSDLENLVTLLSSICKLKSLVELNVSDCSNLESLPEEMGDLENLKKLDARFTLISELPSSIVRLNKLKFLSFADKKSEDGALFVFPQVNEGLRSLEYLNLRYCNLMDGALPEDIGSSYSLKELNFQGNNFEHLPRRIAQLVLFET